MTGTDLGTEVVARTNLVDDTTPYPWPYDAALSMHRVALIVLGWSDAWWEQCHEPERVAGSIVRLAGAVDLVVTVDQPPPAVHGPIDSVPARGHRPTLGSARQVGAAGVDGFFGGPLDAVLRAARCDLLLLVGLGLEAAVHSTMRSANDQGYECLLVVDACAPLNPDLVRPAISMVEMSGGIFGAVGTTEPVLAALANASTHDPIPDFSERNR